MRRSARRASRRRALSIRGRRVRRFTWPEAGDRHAASRQRSSSDGDRSRSRAFGCLRSRAFGCLRSHASRSRGWAPRGASSWARPRASSSASTSAQTIPARRSASCAGVPLASGRSAACVQRGPACRSSSASNVRSCDSCLVHAAACPGQARTRASSGLRLLPSRDERCAPRAVAYSERRKWIAFGRVRASKPSELSVTPRPESFTPVHGSAGSSASHRFM